jgi:DNA-binding HxlR family transcriptional regulator
VKLLLKGETDYNTFKRELNLAYSSLFSHLRALEQEGFVSFRKEFRGRKSSALLRKEEKDLKISGIMY